MILWALLSGILHSNASSPKLQNENPGTHVHFVFIYKTHGKILIY